MDSIVGLKIGILTIISFEQRTKRLTIYTAKCECGNIITLPKGVLSKRKSCGCIRKNIFRDYTGQKNNKLLLMRYIGQNNHKCYIYETLCECGKIFICEANDVISGKIKSCGCVRYKGKSVDVKINSLLLCIYRDYKIKAKQRSLLFDVDYDLFKKLTQSNCYYCNIPPANSKKNLNKTFSINYNGLDRVDNDKDYTPDNIVSCCYICNQAKHLLTKDTFIEWLERILIAKNNKSGVWSNRVTSNGE